MADTIDTREFENPKLPTLLNVLTILSVIGSVFQIGGGIYQYATAKTNFEKKDEVLAQVNSPDTPAAVKKMMPDAATYNDLITKAYENRLPLMLVALVCGALCLYGALEMRKRKKQGLTFYTVGELLPLAASAALLGMSTFTGFNVVLGVALPILFVILYFTQRKYLVH